MDKTTATDGHDIYTVNAVGVKEAATGNKYVKVTGGGTDDFVIDDSLIDTAINTAVGGTGFDLTTSGNATGTSVYRVGKDDKVTIDGGKNIQLKQTDGLISVATSDKVEFTDLTVTGDTKLSNTTIAGNATYNGSEIANKAYVDAGRTVVTPGTNVGITANTNATTGQTTYTVNANDTKVIAGTGVTVTGGDLDSSNIREYTVAVDTTTISSDTVNKGRVVADDNGDKFATAENVATAINSAYWTASDGTNNTSVHAGDTVTFKGKDSKVSVTNTSGVFEIGLSDDVVTQTDLKPLTFGGDTGTPFDRKLGESVKVVGVATTVGGTNKNITVNANDTANQLEIALNPNVDLGSSGSLKTGNTTINNSGVTITGGTNPVSITNTGLDNGGNTITNVAEGVNNTDAVNVEQLNKGLAKATTEVQAGNNIKSVDKTTATDGHDIYTVNAVGVKEAGSGNKYVKVTGGGTDDFVIDDSAIDSAIGDASFSLTSSNQGANTGVTEEIKKGSTVTINGGSDNVAISQTGGTITVDVAQDVKFDSVETGTLKAGDTKLGDNFEVKGGKVTYNQTPSDDNEVVNKKYADSLGWDLQVNDTKQGDTITNGKAVNFANGDNTTVQFEDNAVKVNVNTTTLTATDGKVNNPATGGNNLTTAQNVADMINQSYWIAQDGNGKQTQVKAGDTVSWQGQGSLKVENSNGIFTISDNTTYTSTVTGLTLDKKGDTVELGGDLTQFVNDTVKPLKFKGDSGDTIEPKHGDTVEIVGDNNISVVGENGKLNVKLSENIDLGNSGSLKTGDTTINNNGVTVGGVSLTKDGLDNGGNKITNVAAGVDDTDAVNVGQLNDAITNVNTTINSNVNQVIYGTDNPTDKEKGWLKTYNADSDAVHVTNSVAEAIHNMNEYGIKYFHTNDGSTNPNREDSDTDDSIAYDKHATSIGFAARAAGDSALAMGHGATTGADNAIAIGNGAQATGEKSISIGAGNIVSGARSGAIGDPNVITGSDSWALGNENTISTNNTHVVGNNVKTTADNSVFLGNNTAYTAAGASTAGTEAHATNHEDIKDVNGNVVIAKDELKFAGSHDNTGVVSVGDVGNERRIQNVAPGKLSAESTDAINGSQLYSVAQKVGQVSSGGAGIVQYSNPDNPTVPNGGVATNDVTLVGADKAAPVTIHNVAAGRAPTDAVNVSQLQQVAGDIHNRIGDVSKHADASAASAIAVASMPQAFLPGKNLVAIGGGTYHGQTGYAIGFSTISDNGHWIVKGTATGNSKNRYGAGVGAGYQW